MRMGWSVGVQTVTQGALPDGSYGEVVDVPFTTDTGIKDHVVIPKSAYTAENVKAAIGALVAEHDAVTHLTG